VVAVLRTLWAKARDDERGFSLPELLVAVMVATIVAGAGLTVVMLALRAEPKVADRSAQIQEGRVLIERVSRELRQGTDVLSANATGLQVLTHVGSSACGGPAASTAIVCRVTYACVSTSCTRTERNPDGSGSAPAQQVVSGIRGPNVFSYQPGPTDPDYIGITLSFPDENGAETVTLEDGVYALGPERYTFEGSG
jgi:prepilin-type N-terminal cleavage/methylation domain-containing protein